MNKEEHKAVIESALNVIEGTNNEIKSMQEKVDSFALGVNKMEGLFDLIGRLVAQMRFLKVVLLNAYEATGDVYYEEVRIQTERILEGIEDDIRKFART